ncbi:NAD(P)/FAD-dependent oxidoreductase [Citreimonas salinaria]|uniref:NAD(P)/FAD-dependent oxidoreductase n=1 Tax=Citreimonas salinaria TaxID=321339 RepID=UPI001FE22A93|nr:NAD(P)/FAD-dependent oxidoreductase [Citreimonas salinaria]
MVGGGFGGATAARFLARAGHDVTLVERDASYVTCPFSNTVLGGFARMSDITFGYDGLAAEGVQVVQGEAVGVADGTVTLASGDALPFDRLLLSPGVELRYDALPGYSEDAAQKMPHAWKGGPQTELLRSQLTNMEDGGLVVIAPPANPYRCPPGPYERASLIAHYLSAAKPASKILILDAKEAFSKQALFEEAWATLYPGMIEWIPPSGGGRVAEVDPSTMTVVTDFGRYDAAVANIIPPQRAASIAQVAGVADQTGWCPVSGLTFESDLVPGIHVIGDACMAGAMPKSAFSANAQAKVAAVAIDALLRGESATSPKLLNTCYSLAAPGYGFTVAGAYGEADGKLFEIEGAGGVSPLDAPESVRSAEADYARSWYATITTEAFA